MTDERKASIAITVKDQGVGIPESDLKSIFEPFNRSNVEMRKRFNSGGYGVGLSICRKICSCLGGVITVQSKEGHGSSFKFTMDCIVDTQVSTNRIELVNGISVPRSMQLKESGSLALGE